MHRLPSRVPARIACQTQYYGQVTFMDEVTVAKAVQAANGTRWDSSIISVEAHHKAHLAAK
jgi:hypothetical protein